MICKTLVAELNCVCVSANAGCCHRGDVHPDQGGVPAADDGRGAVADTHREEEPRHVLLLHAGEARAARRLHEPAEAGISWRHVVEHGRLDFPVAHIPSK